jgi:type IV pilus assembly protein PilC
MVANSQFILLGTGGLVYLVYRFAATPEGKATYQRLAYHMPLFGELMRKSGVARFSRTMATLLASAVNLLDAIDICRLTVDNVVIEDYIAKMRTEIEKGKTLAAVIYGMPVFPKMAVQMISVGEQTGNLDRMLEKVADIYEDEVEEVVGNITKMIEPLMLVFLGGTVAVLLISMYLPIFQLAGANN